MQVLDGGEETRDGGAAVEHAVRLAREAEVDGDALQERGLCPGGRGEAARIGEGDGFEVGEDVGSVLWRQLERWDADEAVGVHDVSDAFCVGFEDGCCFRHKLKKQWVSL